MSPNPQVIACIPYFRCQQYIRRAVESLLNQTYKNIIVVVINDADFETPPWPVLSDICDPRLVRFDLKENKGPYFATQIVLQSTKAPYLLIQDADDWSHPNRIDLLLKKLLRDKTAFVTSDRIFYKEHSNGLTTLSKRENNSQTKFVPDEELKFRLPHHGLFKSELLKNIGGYYGGFKISYDMYLTNIILLIGAASSVPSPLYNYYKRFESLTGCRVTGIGSPERQKINDQLQNLFSQVYYYHKKFVSGKIDTATLFGHIKNLNLCNISPKDNYILQKETKNLNILIRAN